jgi:hypothetical protein
MRFRQGVIVLVGALALTAGCCASASASTWTVRQLDDGPVLANLWGVSCPTTSLCVAVGTNSTVATSTDPLGPGSAWRAVHPEGYANPEAPPGTPPDAKKSYLGNAIRGVSCPSPRLCVAAGPQGNILVSTDPTGPVSAWRIVELGLEATRMNAISCPSPALCIAVAYNGKVIASTNPTGDASAWKVDRLTTPLDFLGVSCASASLCVAVDNQGRIAASTDPAGGASAWKMVGAPAGAASLSGVSCPTLALCVTANAGQILTSTDPSGALAAWRVVSAGTGLSVKGMSCPSATACAGVDNNADVLTSTDPTGGPAAWSFENVLPAPSAKTGSPDGNGMFGISCPTASLCLAVGTDSKIIASSNPFERDTAKVPIRGSKRRPGVHITRHPAKRLDPRRGSRRVAFGFRATGKAKRFKCKLDDRRFRACESPVRYHVRRGKHVFRVFAIGPSGLRGRRASFHFRVGGLTEPPPAGSCKPGQESRPGSSCIPLR